MKLWMILVKFMFIGALFIVSNENLHLNDKEDLDTFFGLYYGWLEQLYSQTLEIGSYVVYSGWLPGEGNVSVIEESVVFGGKASTAT